MTKDRKAAGRNQCHEDTTRESSRFDIENKPGFICRSSILKNPLPVLLADPSLGFAVVEESACAARRNTTNRLGRLVEERKTLVRRANLGRVSKASRSSGFQWGRPELFVADSICVE